MPYLSPNEFLELWQKVHGSLDEPLQGRFLRHPALPNILLFESSQIKRALKEHRKLDELLEYMEGQAVPSKSAKSEYVKVRPIQTIARRSIQPGVRDFPRPKNGGSATVRKPGKKERGLPGKMTCPSCGSVIRGHDLRCKCS